MRKKATLRGFRALFTGVMLSLLPCTALLAQDGGDEGTVTLSKEVLMDKIKGGWAAQTIGCAYGGPTEFVYRGVMIPDATEIKYDEHHLKYYFDNIPTLYDDIYMDLTFMDTYYKHGLDTHVDSFALAFAHAGYSLWHANQQARYNILRGIMPPESGHWKNNPHADCIDFQIESDFAGLMSPGMPNAASAISDKIGHIMNYGDGWYGGVFIGAMYTLAFVENDIETVVQKALQTIPKESKFYERINAVITWYKEDPTDWKRCWTLYNQYYSRDVGCPELILAPGNIDATMNSAYVVMGLLYGAGDFGKTMEISTRCGQDSDCNPSSAAGVLATMKGYSWIPEKWMPNLREVEDRVFSYTKISLNKAYQMSYDLALQMIEKYGGTVGENDVTIKVQTPETVRLEQGFPNMKPKLLTSNIEYLGQEKAGQNEFKFHGTGIVFYGNISYPDNKFVAQLEVTLDGEVDCVMPIPAAGHDRTADALYWKYELEDGPHTVSFKFLNAKSSANIKVDRAIYYVPDEEVEVPTLQPVIFNRWADAYTNGVSLDYDNDGIQDVFMTGSEMGVHLLNGTGESVHPGAYKENFYIGDIKNVDFFASLYPVDFDGDGNLDLVAFDAEPSGKTTDDGGPEGIFLGDGTGKFVLAKTIVYEEDGTTLDDDFNWTWIKSGDVADFTGNGCLDLVVVSDHAGYNNLLINEGVDETGAFKFRKRSYDTKDRYLILNKAWNQCAGYVKAYDFNSDGYMDFFLAGSNSSSATYYCLNTPDDPGKFSIKKFPTTRYVPSFDIADVNNDGYPDVYFSGEYKNGWFNQIYAYDSATDKFKLWNTLPWQNNDICMGYRSSVFVDWDGDGIVDIIQTGRSDTELSFGQNLDSRASKIRINYGDGTEWKDPILTAGSNMNTGILSDMNNDGVVDYLRNGSNDLAVSLDDLNYSRGNLFTATLNPSTTVYQPEAPVLNEPVIDSTTVTLSWEAPASAKGNETYEYVVFDSKDRRVAGTGVADVESGKRKVFANGNACQAKQVKLTLPNGKYTYAVQTVSTAYVGSKFVTGKFKIAASGISKTKVKKNKATAYYSLDGKQVTSDNSGINIVRYADGTAKKVKK